VSGLEPPASVPLGTGRTVLIDPGHSGGTAGHAAELNRQVPDGRGGTKACNTTGTQTDAGYPEHQFTWQVAQHVRQLLTTQGVRVALTRNDDTSLGPCVDERGQMPAKVNADLAVSIHADGGPPAGYGFHVIYPKPPRNAAQGTPSLELATALRDALHDSGLPTSTYIGENGLNGRADLAGLNLSARPIAMIECGNMRNAAEAITLSSDAGQARYAQAITTGILNWLNGHPTNH